MAKSYGGPPSCFLTIVLSAEECGAGRNVEIVPNSAKEILKCNNS